MPLEQIIKEIRPLDRGVEEAAAARLDSLTKPRGSLGRLEELVRRYAAIRRDPEARFSGAAIAVFISDHGVADEGVSAYPQSVTLEMLRNFASGGAAICVMARRFNYRLRVVDMGIATDTSSTPLGDVVYKRIGAGTANLARGPAMTGDQMRHGVEAGIQTARELVAGGATLIGIGEMGIANSTSAAAILAATTKIPPAKLVGRGSGLDDAGVARKIAVVERALGFHRDALSSAESTLMSLGGFEIAAMAGACLGGAALHVPIVVDGFTATAAAVIAARMHPALLDYLLFSHRSAEGGHALALEALGARPILDLGMRLGEGTGAALAMNLIETALDLYHRMATFESAGVSGKLR